MGYVGELSDHLHGIRELLAAADKSVDAAGASCKIREKHHREVGRIRAHFEVLGDSAARVLLEVDVLPDPREVKVHRPPADIEIDAGG